MMKHSPQFEQLCEEARRQVTEISAPDTWQKIQADSDKQAGGKSRTILLDVREDHEVAQGMIAGARHLGRGILERDIEMQIPDKNQEMILYCGGGYRSALSALNLQKMGYTQVFSLAGGWRQWKELGLPTA
jgi:rhodanese-related sulfurtransferase